MLEIQLLKPETERVLIDFFAAIAKNDYARYYHPFDLTPETARELCNLSGKDLHYVLTDKETILGYGMLRGWDEGYSVPSLGIIIHPRAAGKGLGTMFVRFLHITAWLRGCSAVRLVVYKKNTPALKMYKKLGYEFSNKNDKEYVGILRRDDAK